MNPSLAEKRDRLLQLVSGYESCAVAMSAGVDSSVVAKAAALALECRAVAVTASSASLAQGELEQAQRLAEQIGIRHEVIETGELSRDGYRRNAPDRCYHCKTELYAQLEGVAQRLGVAVLVNGANFDDLSDYRPGLRAASERQIQSPLADCGITKAEVRELARHWALPVWDKPASPCLSSRIAYGEQVTAERLAMVDAAEQYLRQLDLRNVRVRYHRGDLARLEVPGDAIERTSQQSVREPLIAHLKSLGFRFVTLDLEGFRSGSLNDLIQIESLSAGR